MRKKLIIWTLIMLLNSSCVAGLTTETVTPETKPEHQPTLSLPTMSIVDTPTILPSPTPTSTPLPEIGKPYTGYWLKMEKDFQGSGYQVMKLMYQSGYDLVEVAWFCVRGSDNNTSDGFYFIAIDRPTTYPTAHGGYADTFFSHNFGWKFANRNWYLHSAPWNDLGEEGCPIKNTGGCVNMRPEDFDVILNGGSYLNPITGVETVIPDLKVGTPFVISSENTSCQYLGNCMDVFSCKDGLTCFLTYTCQYCGSNAVSKWNELVVKNPDLNMLLP